MTVPRLHVTERLAAGQEVLLEGDRAHYLRNVLRLREGAAVRPFNALDGEWQATIAKLARHEARVSLLAQVRAPLPEPGPTLVFAPIRRNRLDWMVEKAIELQQVYFKNAYEGFVTQATKIGALYADLVKETYKPFEGYVTKITQAK